MEETPIKTIPPSNGPRPHRCEVCQRSFREVATLRKHEQLHRADRPYVCNTCGKSFLWSSNLKVHERVHTGERPYKCKICHRCFTQSNDLRRHERNVHMRGKIYGYKTAGRHNSQSDSQQVNLAAYQAFAMQQRALLQQALTYESYLQKAAVGGGQAAQLFHHTQGMGGTGTAPMVGPRPPDPASSPRSPLKLEQTDGMELPHSRAGSLPSFSSFRPMQRSLEGLPGMALGPRHLPPGHRPHPHLGDSHTLPHPNLRLTQEMINFHHQHNNNNNSSTSNNNTNSTTTTNSNGPLTSRRSPPSLSPQEMSDHDKELDQSGMRNREMGQRRLSREGSREFDRDSDREMDGQRENGPSREFNHEHENSMERNQRDGLQSQDRPHSADYHQHPHHQQHLSRDMLESRNSTRSLEEDHHNKSYPCDSVMDLSMNKSSNSPPSRASSTASSTVDKEVAVMVMPPPKTPTSVGAESENEPGKRDVTTTSATPTADSGGIHHCQHCNIFFYDYTMFHLHESLHMPYEDHPFRCPSCGTHCQDKIEFMFHTVWHVKYPHTIPNYTPFREGFLSSP